MENQTLLKRLHTWALILAVVPFVPYLFPNPCLADQTVHHSSKALTVILFYSPGCSGCQKAKAVLNRAAGTFGAKMKVEMRNIDDLKVYKQLIKFEEKYGSKENETLKVFAGNQYIAGPDNIAKKLKQVIEEELTKGNATFDLESAGKTDTLFRVEVKSTKESLAPIVSRFQNFRILPLMAAGLIDGINPCAFATLVFFIGYLTTMKRTGKEVLWVGGAFTLGVFIVYFLTGLGLSEGLRQLEFLPKVSAAAVMSGLSVTAAVLMEIFSAPAWSSARTSSSSLIPPPMV